jgi:hypothetical protein
MEGDQIAGECPPVSETPDPNAGPFFYHCAGCGASGPRSNQRDRVRVYWDQREGCELEEHIRRLEWKLRDLGAEHKRVSELLAAAVARERELKMELEDLRMLAEDLLEDVVDSETIEFARMRARQAIKEYFKEERK